MNWYFEIWADAIDKAEKSESYMSHKDKMSTLLIIFSVAQGFNLVTIFFVIGSFFEFNPFLSINVFPNKYINTALSGIVTLFLPFLVLNYFLVFHKGKYKQLINGKRLNTGGKVFMLYFICSVLMFLLIVIFGKWL